MVTINDKKENRLPDELNSLIAYLQANDYAKNSEGTIYEKLEDEELEKSESWLNPYKKIETTVVTKYKKDVLVSIDIFNNRLTIEEF